MRRVRWVAVAFGTALLVADGPAADDSALAARHRRPVPDRPDPILALATPWRGAWRAAPGADAPDARLSVEVTDTTVVVALVGTEFAGRWGFTRDPASARWSGVALDGPPVAWRVEAAAGGLSFGDDHAEIPTDVRIASADDGSLSLEVVEGCIGSSPVRFVREAGAR